MNCIVIHGSNINDKERHTNPDYVTKNKKNWIPWIKEQLESKGIETFTPLMPNQWDPEYESWKQEFEKLKDKINEDTVLVGHSCGTAFLLRYLSETHIKIKKLILIAPAIIPKGFTHYLKEFFNFKIDEKIKETIKEMVIFTSDNDSQPYLDSAKQLYEIFQCKLVEFKGYGHFVKKHMGAIEFPELLKEVLD